MCMICERIELFKKKDNPYFIHEFKYSIFVVGDHQYFDGYALLLYKDHVSDITDLPLEIQKEYFEEVMISGKALQKHFSPYRMNYSCLGNLEEHVHFHLFPRFKEELKEAKKKNPWNNSQLFKDHKLTHKEAISLGSEIRATLKELI